MERTDETTLSKTAVTTGEPAPLVTPTITRYQMIATAIISAIEATAAEVPGYGDDLSDVARGLRKPVPPEVIAMVVFAVEASPELTGVDQLNTVEARDTLQFSDAFRPVVDHILGVAKRLTLMMDAREAKAGRRALHVYSIACRLARDPDNTHLTVHVANIRAALRRLRIGRPPKASKPAPAPPAAEGDGPGTN